LLEVCVSDVLYVSLHGLRNCGTLVYVL
jgi:hypothetical protein